MFSRNIRNEECDVRDEDFLKGLLVDWYGKGKRN